MSDVGNPVAHALRSPLQAHALLSASYDLDCGIQIKRRVLSEVDAAAYDREVEQMKRIAVVLLTFIILLPLPAWAAAEMNGTLVKVDKAKNQIVVRTDKGEETLIVTKSTKGMEHAREGAKVTVKFSAQDGQPKVTEIFKGD